jgi:hypothetical protein
MFGKRASRYQKLRSVRVPLPQVTHSWPRTPQQPCCVAAGPPVAFAVIGAKTNGIPKARRWLSENLVSVNSKNRFWQVWGAGDATWALFSAYFWGAVHVGRGGDLCACSSSNTTGRPGPPLAGSYIVHRTLWSRWLPSSAPLPRLLPSLLKGVSEVALRAATAPVGERRAQVGPPLSVSFAAQRRPGSRVTETGLAAVRRRSSPLWRLSPIWR